MRHFQAVPFKLIALFLLFALVAIAGNYFSLQLYWGIPVLFGSMAVLVAIRFCGAAWGLGVALVSAVATASLLHNPDIMLVQVGEALAVGLAFRRLSHNMVLLDGAFWLLLGMPFTALVQYWTLGSGSDIPLVMALCAGINGVFNVLMASLLVQALFLWRWFGISSDREYSLTLRQLLFNLLVSSALMPALLVAVLDSRHQHGTMEHEIQDELKSLSKAVAEQLTKMPVEQGAETELMRFGGLRELKKTELTLLGSSGMVVASSRLDIKPGNLYDLQRSGETQSIGETAYLWLPSAAGQTAALRWKDMRYVMETPLSGVRDGKLIAEISSAFYQQEAFAALKKTVLVLSGIIGLAFFLGWLLSRWLSNPLIQLAQETSNLRFKLLDKFELELPDSPLLEMENLVLNFRETAVALHKSFSELYGFAELLEMRVEERTRELSQTNEQLKHEIAIRTEQALQLGRTSAELETQKFALDQHSIVGITDRNGMITYVNDKFCQVSQYAREELVGQDHRMLNSGYHPKAFFGEMRATIGRGQVWQGVIRNRKKDGSFYWVDTTIVPFMDAENQPYQYVSIRTDITERKRFEEDLVHAKEAAEEASHAKSEFLSRMSHELRTPLNAIIGFAQILESGVDGELTEGQRESTANVLQASWHLLDLISEILDLARIESGRMAIALESVELAPLLDECVDMILPLANARRIQIKDAINHAAEIYWVHADRMRLKQVLINLMSNAVKYNNLEGTLSLSCAKVGGGMLRINVADSGIGIPPERIGELFRPFSRLDADKSETQGTGVGLAVTKSLVELMGGRIGVDSEAGKGSIFWVELVEFRAAH